MSMQAENPKAVIGDNQAPDYAQRVTSQMAKDYQEITNVLTGLLAEARTLPAEVTTDEQALANGAVIKRLRDVDARLENHRVVEKEESFDRVYDYYVAKVQQRLALVLNFFDVIVLAGVLVRGAAGVAGLVGLGVRALSVGRVNAYVAWMLAGLAVLWFFASR